MSIEIEKPHPEGGANARYADSVCSNLKQNLISSKKEPDLEYSYCFQEAGHQAADFVHTSLMDEERLLHKLTYPLSGQERDVLLRAYFIRKKQLQEDAGGI